MAFLFKLLFDDKFDENRLSVLDAATIDLFVIVDAGCNTDANCNRDCRSIDFDDEPNSVSSFILANGLFLM